MNKDPSNVARAHAIYLLTKEIHGVSAAILSAKASSTGDALYGKERRMVLSAILGLIFKTNTDDKRSKRAE
ncbi:MAG: hypothetical protein ACLTKQ_07140 [Acutalibacteraceae bacterium]